MRRQKMPALGLVALMALSLTACNVSAGSDSLKSVYKESGTASVAEKTETLADRGAFDYSCNYTVCAGSAVLEAESDDQGTLLSMTYPKVTLKDSTGFENLQESLDALNKSLEEQAEQDYKDYKTQAEEDSESNQDFMPYEMSASVFVRRADDAVLSLCRYDEEYTGGAHGYYSYSGYNYESASGDLLSLKDVVTDYDSLRDILVGLLPETYPDIEFTDLAETLSDYQESDYNWCLDYNGITFFFNPYDLASYADGTQIITLSFEDYPDLFDEEYIQTPDSYCVNLTPGMDYRYDLNGDGELECLQCTYEVMEEDYAYSSPVLMLDGDGISQKVTDEEWCYEMNAVLFHLSNGENYLYIMKLTDDDYDSTTVYKIFNNTFNEAGNLNLGLETSEDDDFVMKTQLTNPDSFAGEIRSDALSTYSAHAEYHVGVDGLPVLSDEWYTVNGSITLTLLEDISFNAVSKDGTVGEPVELEKGTEMTIFRTDNSGYVDFKLNDGSIVRASVVLDTYPVTVDGQDSEQLFDGMRYAG